jgi:glycosidase
LITLNHDNPEVIAYVGDVMRHWLSRGADGWRLDAAYAMPDAFWAAVIPGVREAYPDAWYVGEVIHGDYSARVRDARFDSVTQYELWKAIWSALNDNNFHELDWALQRHNDFLDSFAPMTFIGNHDVTRIASRLDEPRDLPHALVILMTVGGIPSIYAGDEYGFHGIKEERFGGDDAVRPEFPTAPARMGERETALFRLHQFLIGLRRRHPWLNGATTTAVLLDNRQYVYQSRHGDDALLVALNLDETPLAFSLRDRGFQRGHVLGGDAAPEQADADDVVVGPHGWLVLRLVS